MPEGNREQQWRMDIERRVERLDGSYSELKDAFIVMTHLETRMSQMVREHSEWLDNHEERIRRAESIITDKLAEMTVRMAEMSEKVDFLLSREMRRKGGPETR